MKELSVCKGCRFAEWKKTAAGRLHPNGSGRCRYVVPIPPLPLSMNWGTFYGDTNPRISGGFIERHWLRENPCPVREELPA